MVSVPLNIRNNSTKTSLINIRSLLCNIKSCCFSPRKPVITFFFLPIANFIYMIFGVEVTLKAFKGVCGLLEHWV